MCVGGRRGEQFACALVDLDLTTRNGDGYAVCWGEGDAVTDGPGFSSLVSITCGGVFACGLTPDGEVACWLEEPNPGPVAPGSYTITW